MLDILQCFSITDLRRHWNHIHFLLEEDFNELNSENVANE